MAAAGTVEFWKYWEGRVVDNAFPLLRCLGSGTSSAVFLTEAAGEKGRRAAIRLVRANSPGAEQQLSRWQRTAKLSHPHLIRLLSSGRCQLEETAMLYLVMEYAEEDLSQVVPDRPLTEEETSQMLPPVLSALQHIHRQGLVHGHLKPSNIMAIDDQVKISSDGIGNIGPGVTGPYCSPEIATRGASPAADVWSLGVTLVEVLTQRLPVWRDSAHQNLVLPETISPRFADIIRHCLQPDPQSRWSVDRIAEGFGGPAAVTVPTVAAQVPNILQIVPSVVPNVVPRVVKDVAPPKKSSRRRYLMPLLATLAGLAVIGLVVIRNTPPSTTDVASAPAPVVATPPQVAPPPSPTPQSAPPEKAKPEEPKPETAQSEPAPAEKSQPEKTHVDTRPVASDEILEQVMPAVPQRTQASIRGKFGVNVRVHVDPSGSVSDAKLDLRGPSRYFSELTLQAARKWRFRPTDAAQDWLLRFQFERSGFKVAPAHVSP